MSGWSTMSKSTQRVATGAASMWTQRLMLTLVNLALTPVLFLTVENEALGVWILMNSATGLLALLDFGLSSVLPRWFSFARGQENLEARNISDGRVIDKIDRLLSTGNRLFLIRMVLTLAAGAVLGIIFFYFSSLSPETKEQAQIAWVIIVIGQALLLWDAAWVLALGGFGYVAWRTAIGTGVALISAFGQIIVASMGYGVIGLACVAAPGPIIARYVAIWLFKRWHPEIGRSSATFDASLAKSMRGPALSAWSVTVSKFAILNLDNVYISVFLGVENVPLYFALKQIFNAICMVAIAVGAAASPMLSQHWAASQHDADASARFKMLVLRSSGLGLGLAATGAAFLATQHERLFSVWLGVEGAAPVVVALICTRIVLDTGQTLAIAAARATEFEVYAKLTAICAALSVVLSLTLTPLLGIAGFVLANVIAQGATLHSFGVAWSLKRIEFAADAFLNSALKALGLLAAALALGWACDRLAITFEWSNIFTLAVSVSVFATLGISWWWLLAADAALKRRVRSIILGRRTSAQSPEISE